MTFFCHPGSFGDFRARKRARVCARLFRERERYRLRYRLLILKLGRFSGRQVLLLSRLRFFRLRLQIIQVFVSIQRRHTS